VRIGAHQGLKPRGEHVTVADERDVDSLFRRDDGRLQFGSRALITAERIERDANAHAFLLTAGTRSGSLVLSNCDDLAALVIPASGTHAMGHGQVFAI
jgi:hypothetical protein